MPRKNNQAVRLVELPGEGPSDPPIHNVYARYLMLVPRLRYPLLEAAWLLGISDRQLQYQVDAGEIHPVYDGDKPLFTLQELKRYAAQNHASPPRKAKRQVERRPPPQL